MPETAGAIEFLEPRCLLAGSGLVIVPTFDASITSDPNHAKIEATINSVIARYEAAFTDHITVNITFVEDNRIGLGQSDSSFTTVGYSQFLTALKNGKSTANDTTALQHLPTSTIDPVIGNSSIDITTANAKALGLLPANGTASDSTISVNMSETNLDRMTISPNKYDLAGILSHEIDEVLGLGSGIDGFGGNISPEDLFRYDQNGRRSYTTSSTAKSFFSLDAATHLVQLNQSGGGSDYGDWASSSTPRVQDAFGTPGIIVDPSIELVALDVIGYHLIPAGTNHAPVGTAATVTTLEDMAYVFKVTDFRFADPNDNPPNALAAVKVTTLPTAGSVTDNGVAVTAGTFIPVADISGGKLKFVPVANKNGMSYSGFTFQVKDNGGTANGGVDIDTTARKLTINVTSVNDAPSGTSRTVTSPEDAAYVIKTTDFGFTDPNDSPANALLAVQIVILPNSGVLTDGGLPLRAGQFVSASDLSAGKLVFKPKANLNGGPYFVCKFIVVDNGGTANGGIDRDSVGKVMDIRLTSVNDAPIGTAKTVTTLENKPYVFQLSDFGFTDTNDAPANALLEVKITSLPTVGILTAGGLAITTGEKISPGAIVKGLLKFSPVVNQTGAAYSSFTFQVQDNGGTLNGGIDLDPTARKMTISVL